MNINIDILIVRYLSGEASENEKTELQRWISENEDNKQAFLRYEAYFKAEVRSTVCRDPEALYDRLSSNISTSMPRKFALPINLWRYVSVAAVAAAITGLVFLPNLSEETPTTKPTQIYSLVTGDATSSFFLPDSSEITLNKNSVLTYSDHYNDKVREVTLSGEAYFKVRKHKDRSFIVKIDETQITVLGTEFNVRAYTGENELRATLVEGSVRFDAAGRTVTMKPDYQLVFSRTDKRLEVDSVDVETSIAWKEHKIRYQSIAFPELLTMLQNQYGVKFVLRSSELSNTVVSGSFDNSLTVEQILNLTRQNIRFTWKKEGDTYLITKNK
ncbi:MAG: FecR domain-containing protein [Tannerella sp.]|jgi:ferric-dicitrate binding protein FerR (iron transport regulator)|nr:FecR domain-containing protein [Tannerella sp.]